MTTKVLSLFNLNRRGSGANLNLFRSVAMVLLCVLAIGNAWGHSKHYGKAVLQNATGHGTVYLSTKSDSNSGQTGTTGTAGAAGSTSYITWNCGESESNDSKTYYARYSAADDGWYFAGWATAANATSYTASTTGKSFSASSTSSGSPTSTTIYGFFKPVTVTGAPANVNINATDPSATYNDAAGTVVSFTTANSNKIGDFTTAESGDARWVISAWTRASASSATFNYKFVGDGSYGETDRTFTKTVTLTSKGDASTRSCTLTAKYPNPKVVSADESDEYTKIFTTFKATDATQTAVEKTAVFDVAYADDGNNFTAAFSGVTGGGTWDVSGIVVDQANQKATVTYTFNGNKKEGTHTALLALTAKDCNGWNDGEVAGSASASVTITAENEQEATDDAKVTKANGDLVYQGDWATAIASHQGDEYTFTLLRNVAVTAAATFSKTITLDLNGKTLSGTVNNMLTINGTGKTLTIKDGKTGGMVTVTTADNATRSVISLAKGKLVLESGKIQMNATNTGSSVVARGVTMASGTTFDMNGGSIEAISAGLKPTAVYVVGTFNMTDGTLTTEAGTTTAYTLWINNGTANVTGGTITAHTIRTGSAAVYMDNAKAVLNIQDATLHAIADATNLTEAGSANAYGVFNYTAGGTINVRKNAKIKGEANNSSYGQYGYGIVNRVANCKANILENTGVEIVGYSHYRYGIGISNAGTLDIIGGLIKGETDAIHGADYGWGLSTSGTATIHGGEFKGVTRKSNARGISSTGTTTIEDAKLTADATTSAAYGLYVGNKKTIATNVIIEAKTTTSGAHGVYLEPALNSKTGAKSEPEAELNNVTSTAESTTTTASGVTALTTRRLITSTASGYTPGDYLAKSTLTINGGTYKGIAGTQYGYGAYIYKPCFIADGSESAVAKATITNAQFIAKSTGANNGCYGIRTGGTTTIDGCDITAIAGAGNGETPAASSSFGILVDDQKTTVSNTTITSKGLTKAYGIYVNAAVFTSSADASRWPTYGYTFQGEVEVNGNNQITAQTTGGETAYGIYVHAAKANVASGVLAGDHATAGTAVVNAGKYTAHASGTTGYAACVADPVVQGEATATPTLIINDGKFKGTAGTTPYADVSLAGEPGYFVLNGGYYVKDENLDKKLGEGMNKVAVKSGTPEYTEGYRWRVTDNMTGEAVCKITQNSTSYASLEEALQVVNASPNSTWTIVMIANYTLSKGDYEIPANTTLLIPYKSNQTTANGTTPVWVDKRNTPTPTTPSPYMKLTFANGVNMTVKGKIEASSTTYINQNNWTGVPGGPYGWLQLNEGSHIDLESGAYLFAWGYVTGTGDINAKNGSYIYEDFQMGDWRGGTISSDINGNKNGLGSKGVFLLTDYYFQNVECPITYRPGAQSVAYSGCYMEKPNYGLYIQGKSDPVTMVGTSGAMFLMSPATAGENTWVRKEYDSEKDQLVWTLNSGASLGSFRLKISASFIDVDMNTSDYVLPMATNFKIVANEGDINITNDICFLPGSEAIVNKEANLVVASGKRVFVYDSDDWSSYGGYYHKIGYSPSWKACPRTTTKLPDAKIEIAGTLTINGSIYTTAGGGNIFSTRENSGKIKFNAVAPASTEAIAQFTGTKNTTLCQIVGYADDKVQYVGKALTAAKLKNEDGEYTPTTGSAVGSIYAYMEDPADGVYRWLNVRDNGCFTEITGVDTKQYIHPSDFVAVEENANGDHAYHNLASTRMFVNAEAASTNASCVWWEVNPTPEVIDAVTYYVANNENFDNFGIYYYWDNSVSYWKPKKVTVTWNDKDGNKITNGTFGDEYNFNTSPQFFGANPVWANTSTEKHDWIGWRDEDGNIYDKNATLPRATEDITYTAYFQTSKYQYTITFKNDDNTDLWAGLVDAGTTGAQLQALFETKYNEKTGSTIPLKAPSVDKVYTFDSWNTTLATVTAAATYTASYTWTTRKYHVTFYNYDAATVLYEADVDYNTRPVYGGVTPFRSNTSAFSYEWTGWQQGATHYGTTADLALVTGDVYYVATFSQTTLKYQVLFKRQDGTIIDAPFFEYEETPEAFPANPTLASTVSTDYTFDHWDPATLTPVTEDGKVYTAYFSGSPRKYTAHFVNYNGTSLNADQTIDYNTVPAYTGAAPIKPNDSRNSYEFSGWAWEAGADWEAGSIGVGEAFPAIKGDITFTAQFTPVLLQFNVIYKREDGTIIEQQKKKWGESTAFPSVSNYEDATHTYTFDHWSPATVVTPVTTDATYTAYFTQAIKTYSLSSIAATPAGYGSVSPASVSGIPSGSSVTVNDNKITVNGQTITATPTAADAQYTYAFDHWNNVPATVTGNVTNIQAVFTRTVNTYTIIWKNGDTTLETDENVEFGATPTYNSAEPTKAATAEWTYTFNGWSPAIESVSGDATYTATFSATKNSYEITWLNDDNSLIDKTTVEYGVVPTHADATKANTAEYTYTFTGWDNTPVAVTGTATYKATFSSSKNSYEITWLNDDNSLIDKTTVEYGVVPTHADATKENTAEWTYTFTGWDNTPVAVTGTATYKATFSSSKNSYEITWLNDDNSLIDKTTVEYGIVPTHAEATKANTASNCYTFAGWDSEIVAVTGAKTYKATFSASPTVAAVTAGGTTYYATLQAAFNYAADKTTPTITVLDDITLAAKVTYTNTSKTTVTFDLNGHTVSGALNPLLTLTSATSTGGLIVIKSSVEGGQIRNVVNSNAARACVVLSKGQLRFESGKIYMENKSTSSSVQAYGIQVVSSRTFTMIDGTVEVKSTKHAYAIYSSGTTNIEGGELIATETKNGYAAGVHVVNGTATISENPTITVSGIKYVNGVRVGGLTPAINSGKTAVTMYNGVANIEGGNYTVTASTNTAYGVYCYGNTFKVDYATNATLAGNYANGGTANVSGGEFSVTSNGATAYGVCMQTPATIQTALDADGNATYDAATTHPKANITGGKFDVSGTSSVGAVNTAAANTALVVKGGWYNIDDNLSGYVAPTKSCNYWVLPLTGEDPYKHEVAEAYKVTWDATTNGGSCATPYTIVKKGTAIGTLPVATKANHTFDGWFTTYTGAGNAVTASAVINFAITYYARFTPNTYGITYRDQGNVAFSGSNLASLPATHTYGTATALVNGTKTDYTFDGWFANPECTGDPITSLGATAYNADITLYAKWTLAAEDRELDIVDWTSSSITINVINLKTKDNKTNWAIRVNDVDYTKSNCITTTRTLTVTGLTLEADENLLIQVKNGSGIVESYHNYTIPHLYNSANATLTDAEPTSIVYVYGGKLTISGNTTLAALYVCPGAEVEVANGTLTVGKLVLRTKPWATAAISGNVEATNIYYTRIAPDGSDAYPTGQYYQFGLPYECAISNVRLSDGTTPAYSTTWLLKSYNEERRAASGTSTNNWDALAADATIAAGRGYEMFSSYKYYREYYFPVTPTKNTSVAVTRHGEDKNNSGWNIVCSPLMSVYENPSDPVDGLKVSWLLTDGSYDQEWPETIWPAMPFSYQASANGSLDFSKDNFNQAVSAPRRAAYKENIQTEWLHLDVKDGNGVGDHTSVFVHPDRFEATYQTGIDVAKQSFTASRALIYSSHAYGEMAFAGVADTLLEQGVALTVYSPIAQELTISMRENDWLNRMRYVWLVDHETGARTDLLWDTYTFEVTEGTARGRFTIEGVFRTPQITTDIENAEMMNDEMMKVRKVLINQKMYILRGDQMYDATGKKVSK